MIQVLPGARGAAAAGAQQPRAHSSLRNAPHASRARLPLAAHAGSTPTSVHTPGPAPGPGACLEGMEGGKGSRISLASLSHHTRMEDVGLSHLQEGFLGAALEHEGLGALQLLGLEVAIPGVHLLHLVTYHLGQLAARLHRSRRPPQLLRHLHLLFPRPQPSRYGRKEACAVACGRWLWRLLGAPQAACHGACAAPCAAPCPAPSSHVIITCHHHTSSRVTLEACACAT